MQTLSTLALAFTYESLRSFTLLGRGSPGPVQSDRRMRMVVMGVCQSWHLVDLIEGALELRRRVVFVLGAVLSIVQLHRFASAVDIAVLAGHQPFLLLLLPRFQALADIAAIDLRWSRNILLNYLYFWKLL